MFGAKKTKYSLSILIFGIIIWLFYSAIQNSKEVQRDVLTLFNFYYRFKISNPFKAKEALDLILQQSPNNQIAIRAMADWYLRQGDTHSALQFMEEKYQHDRNDDYIGYKLMKLYISLNEQQKASVIFQHLLMSENRSIVHQARINYQSAYPMDLLNTEISERPSLIEPIHFVPKTDFTPLYKKVQDVIRLQPNSAKKILLQIISIDKNAQEAYVLLGYLELQEKLINQALPYFVKAFEIKPSAWLALQLGYIYAELKNNIKATEYFNYVVMNGSEPLKQQSMKALYVLKNQLPLNFSTLSAGTFIPQIQSPKDKLWNMFYQNTSTHKDLAWRAIEKLLILNPDNIRALKEAAYLATTQKMNERAITYWKRAYAIEPNPEYAMSLGYLYDGIDRKSSAFRYFDLASKTRNKALHDKAEMAMTNMGGAI
jgi:tetratricopeptide (TPR) repeat protein